MPLSASRLHRTALFGIGWVLLCVPALLNRSPLIFADSKSYYTGGGVAVDKAAAIVDKTLHQAGAAPDANDTKLQQARGVRSAFYAMLVYGLTRLLSLWAVVGLQALLAVWSLHLVYRVFRPAQPRPGWRNILILALFSSVPWMVSLIMPDVFAGLLVLGFAALLIGWNGLSWRTKLAALALFTASLLMHITNLPIAWALLGVGALLSWRQFATRWQPLAALSAAVLVAMAALLAVSVVGFKQWTLTPNGAPFLTARSIADGPGRLYLQENCPQAGLVMCRHLDRLNLTTEYFIWCKQGVYSTVSPDEQALLRAEDKTLFLRAASAYPWLQAAAIGRNTLAQLLAFGITDLKLPSAAVITPTSFRIIGEEDLMDCPAPGTPAERALKVDLSDYDLHDPATFLAWKFDVSLILYASVLVSIGVLVWLWVTERLTRAGQHLIILVVVAILANALITGGISMPAARYGARVMWLLPLLAGLLWWHDPIRRLVWVTPAQHQRRWRRTEAERIEPALEKPVVPVPRRLPWQR